VFWRRLVSRLFPSGVSEGFVNMHRVVMDNFPETPWVYGGGWSWFTGSLRCLPGVIVYPYLPLVLIDNERYDLSRFSDVLKSCSVYGIPVVSVSDGESQLLVILSRLKSSES